LNYKDEFLERYEYSCKWKIPSMALLGMMDPKRPSNDIEDKKKEEQ